MGTALTGQTVGSTYDSLLKITDNGPVGVTAKVVTDGLGNDSALKVGSAGIESTGTLVVAGASTLTGAVSATGNTKIGAGVASNTEIFMINRPGNTLTGIQLFQDGVESWTIGMEANSATLKWKASGSEKMALSSTGLAVTGEISATGLVSVGGSTPASASATGTAGTITWDSSYVYVCTATNTWKRVAIATW